MNPSRIFRSLIVGAVLSIARAAFDFAAGAFNTRGHVDDISDANPEGGTHEG